jgi:hypothetical protein
MCLCIMLCAFTTGCIFLDPVNKTLIHEPSEKIVVPSKIPGNVTILPMKDTRPLINDGNRDLLRVVPLIPYVNRRFQNGAGDAKSLFSHCEGELPAILGSYVSNSNLFSNVTTSGKNGEIPFC